MQGMMPFLVQGEILEVQKPQKGETTIRYVCSAMMPNGSLVVLRNVRQASMFGGISDYSRRRARTRADASKGPENYTTNQQNASVGERVYIACVGGNLLSPVIIGYIDHPNQTVEKDVQDGKNPNAVFQYLGVRVDISEIGDVTFTHKGAPKVNFAPKAGGLAGAALGALAALTKGVKGNDNPAIEPKPETEVTLWEMLKEGVFRLRDAEGQVFEMDRSKKRIFMTNAGIKSTTAASDPTASALSSPNPALSEFFLMDKGNSLIQLSARKKLKLDSLEAREDSTLGNYKSVVAKDVEWTIGGNSKQTVAKDIDLKVGGNIKETITGNHTETIVGNWMVDGVGDIVLKDKMGATVKISKGKVTIKGATGVELVDILSQTLDQLSQSLGNLGYNLSNAAAFVALKTQLDTIKG